MDDQRDTHQSTYPLIRVLTFGEFVIERLIPSTSAVPCTPRYQRVPWEEWGNRGPALTLLKALICIESRRASRDELIKMIWPDHTLINASHALDSAASVLRRRILRTLGDESLLFTLRGQGETSFKLPGQLRLWVDADAFLNLAAQAIRSEAQGQDPLPLLEQAYELAQGTFLEDDLHQQWPRARRTTINGARHRVLYMLAESYLRTKRVGQAEELLFAFLEENPLDEDALCHLMILLTQRERRQEALNIYEYVVEVLRGEHTEPAPYTKELERRIRHGYTLHERATNYTPALLETLLDHLTVQPAQAEAQLSCATATRIPLVQMALAISYCKKQVIRRRGEIMRVEVHHIHFENYKFVTELDTGAETGAHQLTLWYAEKLDTTSVPLALFKIDQLLQALQEPQRTRLLSQLELERQACQESFATVTPNLQHTPPLARERSAKKEIYKEKQQQRDLQKKLKRALQLLETAFVRRELLPLERDCFNPQILHAANNIFGDWHYLRDFYFEEANERSIRNFCQRFSTNAAYKQEVLARNTHWARRNQLFVRNLPSIISEGTLLADDHSYDLQAHAFFRWIDLHCEQILALPTYQRLQRLDSEFQPCADQLDPEIRLAVELLNRLPGVKTQFSCQGVSGKIRFQDHELLTVSPHEEYAYVSFESLMGTTHDLLQALLPAYPAITTARIPYNFAVRTVLRATGDNLRFRKELIALARCMLIQVDNSWINAEKIPDQTGTDPGPLPTLGLASGILPARLDWLCQPERIEQTFQLLFHLNHWARARDCLLYADRQGLYQVKTTLLQHAYTLGILQAASYTNNQVDFAQDYLLQRATDVAAATVRERLIGLLTSVEEHVDDDDLDRAARTLFRSITGVEAATPAAVEALATQQIAAHIQKSVEILIKQAYTSGQPIPMHELAALFIRPGELFNLRGNNAGIQWDDINEGIRRRLDPEGLSLIAFLYASPTAHYVFHVPYRVAEMFLSEQTLQVLKNVPSYSQECAIYAGQSINADKAALFPLEHILRILQVDVASICPHQLLKK